jgi:hypothetical protein
MFAGDLLVFGRQGLLKRLLAGLGRTAVTLVRVMNFAHDRGCLMVPCSVCFACTCRRSSV